MKFAISDHRVAKAKKLLRGAIDLIDLLFEGDTQRGRNV